jgi:hypothetical protein
MSSGNGPFGLGRGGDPVSHRTAVRELAGIALVLAIPVGAMLATASPIPDPPRRRALNVAPPVDLPTEQQSQEQEAENEKRRTDKKQREEKNRRDDQQPARDESHAVSTDEEEQPSDVEQRDSQP